MTEPQTADQATLDAQAIALQEALANGLDGALEQFGGDSAKFIEELKGADTGISGADMATVEVAIESSGGDGQKFAEGFAQQNQNLMESLAEGIAEMQRKDEQQIRLQTEQDQQADSNQFHIFIALFKAIFGKDNAMLNDLMAKMEEQEGAKNEAAADASAGAPAEEAPDTAEVAENDADASAEYAQSPDGGALTTNVEKPADPTAAEMVATGDDSLSTTERNVTLADGFGNNASATLDDGNVTVVPATVDITPIQPETGPALAESANNGQGPAVDQVIAARF